MKNYFSPKPSVIVQRTKFYTRNRQLGESITDYVAELRSMCEDCRFGTFLDKMLQDKLVVGVNDDNIQRRLLPERDTITFNEALNIESAFKHLQVIQTKKKMEVNKIFAPPRGQTEKIRQEPRSDEECAHCGATHEAIKCPFRYAMRYYCKKRGHIAEKCLKFNIKKKPADTIKKKKKLVRKNRRGKRELG